MNPSDCDKIPHRRLNLLTREWVLVSPHRATRPWSGQEEMPDASDAPAYDRQCYLCPGNMRAGGKKNPQYTDTFVFTNDFPALLPQEKSSHVGPVNELLRAEPEFGICRVLCYSPRHDLPLARMSLPQIVHIVDTWMDERKQLGAHSSINYVQIFENRGQAMGCSNPHPHGQIWANSTIPTIPSRETSAQEQYLNQNKSCLLCDYLKKELDEESRIIFVNNSFIALVPFWAIWPFEMMIIPRKHRSSIDSLLAEEKNDLAEIMSALGICYDNLFLTSFPYSMGIHQQPTDGLAHPEWHWHIHYMPPLLRSKSVKKHMVGYEMLAMPQRDLTPESAASRLKSLPKRHYLDREEVS